MRSAPLAPPLPHPRGPLSEWLVDALAGRPRRPLPVAGTDLRAADPLVDEDLQLALYCCYELHYRGFAGVDDGCEWDPDVLALRRQMEGRLEAAVRDEVPAWEGGPDGAVAELWAMAADGGPSLSAWLLEHGTWDQARELAVHRSAYQLKEADPHTWAIPRLTGRAKAAMVAIQADEYGGGVPAEVHATLFAATLRALGLDDRYGAYLDLLPAPTLATTNLISWLGLHRRLRGALVGHLALFEMTSVGPMGRYSAWLRRLGVGGDGRRFYDVHVQADELHQHIAARDLVGGLLDDDPSLAPDVVFGARALGAVEGRFAGMLREAWAAGGTALRSAPSSAVVAA